MSSPSQNLSFKDFNQSQKDWGLDFNFPKTKEEFWNFTSWKNLRQTDYKVTTEVFIFHSFDPETKKQTLTLSDDKYAQEGNSVALSSISLNENYELKDNSFSLKLEFKAQSQMDPSVHFPGFFRNLASSKLPLLNLTLNSHNQSKIEVKFQLKNTFLICKLEHQQDPKSEAQLHTEVNCLNPEAFVQLHHFFTVPDQAQLHHSHYLHPGSKSYQEFEFDQGQESEVKSLKLSTRPDWERSHYLFTQQKKLASTHFKSLQIVNKKCFSELIASVNHQDTEGMSDFQSKVIATDQSKSSSRGRVLIDAKALQTNSNQQIRGLLLNENSELFVKPELEVFADDVKANHGAAVGPLDLDKMFYLMSRGLSKETALKSIKEAFVKELFTSSHPQSEILFNKLNLDQIWTQSLES